MKQPKLHKNKVKEIIDKISTLVDIYANVHDIAKYVTSEFNDITIIPASMDTPFPYKNLLLIKRIDFKRYVKQAPNVEAIKFSETLSGLVSDTELEMLFIKKYYPDYMPIAGILQMLLYNIPREVNESDLIELNKLYKKYTKNDTNKTTENTY